MIKIIEDLIEVEKYQGKLEQILNRNLTEKINCRIGFPGGSFEGEVNYSSKYNIWSASITQNDQGRYWNGFGLGEPTTNSNSINGAINISMKPQNKRISGVFGKDENGNILILHRGKVRLTNGHGNFFFGNNYRGDKIEVLEGDQKKTLYLVGELNSDLVILQIRDFISEVQRIKNIAKQGVLVDNKLFSDFNFTAEKFGISEVDSKGKKVINRTHGIIVSALAKQLEEKGFVIANDANRDLFAVKENKISSIFEIKTNSSTQSLYSAVGQLLVYSFPWDYSINLIAVLPSKLKSKIESKLEKIGIVVLYYKIEDNTIDFINLDDINI